jgi:hypothetical protein
VCVCTSSHPPPPPSNQDCHLRSTNRRQRKQTANHRAKRLPTSVMSPVTGLTFRSHPGTSSLARWKKSLLRRWRTRSSGDCPRLTRTRMYLHDEAAGRGGDSKEVATGYRAWPRCVKKWFPPNMATACYFFTWPRQHKGDCHHSLMHVSSAWLALL